jgi:hypothetical protein
MLLIKHRYLIYCARHISRIALGKRYESQIIEKILGASKPKGLNRMAKILGRFTLVLINYII